MSEFLEFECPHCHGRNMSRVVTIERSAAVRLLEGGLITYPGREYANRLVDFDEVITDALFQCESCMNSLRDSDGFAIRTPQSLHAYLLDQASEEQGNEREP